jgi:hypothetical protein
MPRSPFFSDDVMTDLLSGRCCPKCGVPDLPLIVLDPVVVECNNMIELSFRTMCGCGSRATLRLKLPVLMLGLVFARDALRRVAAPPDAPYVPQMVQPKSSGLFRELIRGYTDLIRALPGGALAPSPADQAALEMSEREWRDFLQRMELGPDDTQPAKS